MNQLKLQAARGLLLLCVIAVGIDCLSYTPFSRPDPVDGEPIQIISSRRSDALRRAMLKRVNVNQCTYVGKVDNESFFDYPDWYTSEVVLNNMAKRLGADIVIVNSYNYLTFNMGGRAYRCGGSRTGTAFTPPGEDPAPVPLADSTNRLCRLPADVTLSRLEQPCYDYSLGEAGEAACKRKVRAQLCSDVNEGRAADCNRLCMDKLNREY